MKKIKKIGGLIAIFLLNFYNTCFADVVWIDPETGKVHGGGTLKSSAPKASEPKPVNYILIGILVLVVVICAVIIIKRIIKKKKEKDNDNNK